MTGTPLFSLGTITITPEAGAALARTGDDAAIFLARHQRGDWGEVEDSRRQANEFALRYGRVLYSQYRLSDGTEVLVGTAADRASTRMLLASEFLFREMNTREGYALWAESYDLEQNALIAVEEPLVDALLAELSFADVLDVGSGTGRYALKLARQGAQVTAIDQSPEMLAVAQDAARRAGLAIDFRLVSLEDGLPFEASRFDFLMCALMLCHVPELGHAIQEFARVSRDGGHVLITDFHPDAPEYGWRTEFRRSGIKYLLPNMPHTRANYLEALQANGFIILKVMDIPLGEVPEGYLSEAMLRGNELKRFCLIILARREG